MEGGGGEIKIPLESAVKGVGNVSLSGATCSIRVVPSAGGEAQPGPSLQNDNMDSFGSGNART